MLYAFQQERHLCDVTLVSSDGRQFMAHAGVLAAASELLRQELEECDRGNYKIETSLSGQEINTFIHYAYSGDKSDPLLSSFTLMGLLCDVCDKKSHPKAVIALINTFADQGLFCNMACLTMEGDTKPSHSYMLAAKCPFVSSHIKYGSMVTVQYGSLSYERGTFQDMWSKMVLPDIDYVSSITNSACSYDAYRFQQEIENPNIPDDEISHDKYSEHGSSPDNLSDKPHVCDVCGKRFKTKAYLRSHVSVHTRDRPYKCDGCDETFSCQAHLDRHHLIHTKEKPFVCFTCDKRFTRKSQLKEHQTIHTDNKPHVCEVCQKDFRRKSHLKLHQLIHTDIKDYACDICDKRFTQKSNLKIHQITHSDNKPHACTTCDKHFKMKSHLKEHERIHTNEKPYACATCDKRFKQKSYLKIHHLTHTNSKPHACGLCERSFTQKCHLNKHRSVVHKTAVYTHSSV